MPFFDTHHDDYRDLVRDYLAHEVVPSYARWESDGLIDRSVWESAAQRGLTGLDIEPEYGGMGMHDWRFRMVVTEELGAVGAASLNSAFTAQDDLVVPCLRGLGTPEQHQRWLPDLAAGRTVGAIALTEPGAGSDLQALRTSAVRNGDGWVLNGQKAFVSGGLSADLVIVAASTAPGTGAAGLTLFVVERDFPGFERGRPLDKLGLHAQDTVELFFTDCRVPAENLLGEEGAGFTALVRHLPRARLALGVCAWAGAAGALAWTEDHVFERRAFGMRIGDLQHTRFRLAEVATDLDVTGAYLRQCVTRLDEGTLTAVEAAKAKWWATERAERATSRLLQLFGGYGVMEEYPIARAYRDSRVQTIYGGTTEIMKEIIGRDLAARHH